MEEKDGLTLKWRTIKGWEVSSDEFRDALQSYFDIGNHSMSAMSQHDSPDQKEALCKAIDACNGEIWNDWDGVIMSKDEAKKYVMGL